jgi:ribosomal protein S18 acetylase RimI-like enzyme
MPDTDPAAPTIERGTPADLDACIGLWRAALEARDGLPPVAGTAERCRSKFELPRVSWRVRRGVGGGLDGFGLVTAPGTGRVQDPADAAYLSLLATAPAAQGAGLGAAMLEALTDDVRAAGHPAVVLHSLADNAPAGRGYPAPGGRAVGEPFAHSLTGRPTLTLRRELGAPLSSR